jgi:hypothetical protein
MRGTRRAVVSGRAGLVVVAERERHRVDGHEGDEETEFGPVLEPTEHHRDADGGQEHGPPEREPPDRDGDVRGVAAQGRSTAQDRTTTSGFPDPPALSPP